MINCGIRIKNVYYQECYGDEINLEVHCCNLPDGIIGFKKINNWNEFFEKK